MALTRDALRIDIAEILDCDPEEIQDGVNLLDLGLDSLRIMQLTEKWSYSADVPVDFASLAEEPELAAWVRLVSDPTG